MHAHLCTCTQPTQLPTAGGELSAHSQPALRTGLMAPAWRPALCTWGVILDLAWQENLIYLLYKVHRSLGFQIAPVLANSPSEFLSCERAERPSNTAKSRRAHARHPPWPCARAQVRLCNGHPRPRITGTPAVPKPDGPVPCRRTRLPAPKRSTRISELLLTRPLEVSLRTSGRNTRYHSYKAGHCF